MTWTLYDSTGIGTWIEELAPELAGLNVIFVASPGAQADSIGSTVGLQIQAIDSDPAQVLTYAATGLPAGLIVSSSTGLISGTVVTGGTSSVTVTVTDGIGSTATTSFTWTTGNTVTVTNPGDQRDTVGTPASLQFAATDSDASQAFTWAATGLPAGLAVSSSGLISGTPTTAQTASVTATATDTTGASGSASFTWTVAATPPNTVTVTNPGARTGTVGTAVSLQLAATDSAGGQTLTWRATGLPAGLAITTSGLVSGTPTTAQTATVRATATDTTGASGSATFTWTVGAGAADTVTVTNPGARTGTVGTAVSLQLAATDSAVGQTLTWSAAGLPAGLSISTSGLISGTPTTAQTVTATATATDTTGASGSASFTWTVAAAAGNTVTVTNPGSRTGTVGTALSLQLAATDSATGQSFTWSATSLPAGLSISASGLVSGTPTTAQTATVRATATDTTGASGSATFTWTISARATGNTVTVTNPGARTGTVGTTVSLQLAATDSATGQTFTWSAAGLPSGLSASTSGLISGKPTTVQTVTVRVTATDTTGASGSATFTWTISASTGSRGVKGKVGFTVNPNTYGLTDWGAAATRVDGFLGTGYPLAITSQKIYQTDGTYWTSMPSSVASLLALNPRCRILLCAKPLQSPSNLAAEQANLRSSINVLKNAGVDFDVILSQEANDGTNFPSATAYHTYWANYAPTVKAAGVPVCYDPGCNGGSYANGIAFFPGDGSAGYPYPDKWYCDYYGSAWKSGVRLDSATSGSSYMAVADAHNIAFGIGEWGNAAWTSSPISAADFASYTSYLQNLFTARLAAGKKNADIVYFGSTGPGNNIADPILSASDYKIPAIRAIYTALNG